MTDPSDRKTDPEPLTVAALSVATLAMAGTLANAYVNYKRFMHDKGATEGTAAADFLARCDALRTAGERLYSVVSQAGEDGDAAFKMTLRLPRAINPTDGRPLTMRAGESSLELTRNERQLWNELVASAARGAVAMNESVGAYEEALAALLASGRRLEQAIGVSLESVISNVVDHAIAFRKAADSYQNLRAGSTLEDAELRFVRLRIATAALVEAANGFARISQMLIEHRRQQE